MAFFGVGKRGVLDKALTSSWKTPEERDQVLVQLKEAGLKPAEAIPLLWHSDPGVRGAGAEIFVAKPEASALHELVDRMQEQPPHIRASAARIFARIPADLMGKVTDELLVDRAPQRRRAGWEVALSLGGELRVKYLEKAVKDAPVAVRVPALQKLVQERPAAQILDLLLTLAQDSEPRVAGIALEAVAKVPDPRVGELMLDRMQHGDATSRDLARAWLAESAKSNPAATRKKMMDLLASGEIGRAHV